MQNAIENMTDEQLDLVGQQLAEILGLQCSETNKNRWQLWGGWGDKTNKGLALSIKEIIRRIENGQKI
jgi:hypothetical protein